MTVGKPVADLIVEGDGWTDHVDHDAPDNPRVVLIVEYDNAFGGVGYGAVFAGQTNPYVESDFIGNPRIYWTAEKGKTT